MKEKMQMDKENRFEIIQKNLNGELTIAEASELLGLSERQVMRLRKSAMEKGAESLLKHGNAGRPPSTTVDEVQRKRIVELYKEKYSDLNFQQFIDRLKKNERIKISINTAKSILNEAGIQNPNKRRTPKKHIRRTRREMSELNNVAVQESIPIMEYAQGIADDKKKKILLMRLHGHTLEEIGKTFSPPVSRERARQVCASIARAIPKNIAENKYLDVFKEYSFSKEDFILKFEENEITYNYLIFKTGRGEKPLTQIKDNKSLSIDIRKALLKPSTGDYIEIDGEWIQKTRRAVITYVISTYFRNETSFDDFVEFYNEFVHSLNLSDSTQLTINNKRTYENDFSSEGYPVLWKTSRKFRYYDMESYDYTDFWSELNFEQYQNVEYSTLKFFRDYPNLMQRYDIRDEYELHNLLRRLCQRENYNHMEMSKIPTIRFGEVDRNKQALNLLKEISPTTAGGFYKAYEKEYGVLARTAKGVKFIRCLADYYHEDTGLYIYE
jgi:DNA-directed RNA polymerase specialized sigma24 family protein